MIKIFEILAFAVSVAAFAYGAFHLMREETPKYYKLYVCAAGCYMLEELWVIVNSLFGNGAEDGLVTVRLFGFFGCLCFMLSANAGEFDKVVDEEKRKGPKIPALIAPALLLALFALYAFSPDNTRSFLTVAMGFLSILPAIPASYFCLKHLLLPTDGFGLLATTKPINVMALVFFAANYIYPLTDLYCSDTVMCVFDLVIGALLFGIVSACIKGSEKWKTLI